MKFVVDTNVPVAANGRDTHAEMACQYRCIEFLQKLAELSSKCEVVLDDSGLLIEEYSKHLNYRGQPGVGDLFFKYLHDNMYALERIRLVPITPSSDDDVGFEELPENKFDKSDRKILATAVSAKATVVNALDTDWHESGHLLAALKISVKQICPEHGCKKIAKSLDGSTRRRRKKKLA